MKQAVPYFGRFLSKLVLEIIPGALVSVFAAYLLSMLHLGAEPATPSQTASVPQNDGLSGDERRELTRQMLKERRENPEEPAEVKPIPSLRPASPPTSTADLSGPVPHDHVAAPPAAAESKVHAETEAKPSEAKPHAESRPAVAAIAPVTPLPRAPAPRARTEAAAAPVLPPPAAPTVTASLPPVGTAAPVAPPAGAPTPLPQVTVNAPAGNTPAVNAPGTIPAGDLATQPQQRGIVGNIFSGVSTIAGGAANITGNTVNWVIDLPGKAISAGGKLLTGGNGSTPAAAPGGAAVPGNATAAGAPPANAAPAAPPPPTPLPMIDPQRRNFL
jgi:hypothetical protein